ncbi:uncharacterized protein LOC115446204 [Manduca sexta]|uniref:HAUS augmin-like complex subunit 3 N-terminal domain-containing protein n=1 Tax=Manduca sexta TaxID=7130 RepID=A0A921ZB87_MANSE|nr:uncharacterized protein LOC115446204 [Manduca sexta]KAG6454330.1 hypothetical protein O3G_MSEX008631 [Manduca sexta]KAG6454331.1 hypothetical protein O3G_MSEX008631 [Manduca sexta]
MNILDKLSDKEFIPFLQSLGVDTRNQSFEWMLNNPDFAPALEWMYNNLDYSNVLTTREKRRYAEIQKRNNQIGIEISTNEIDENIASITEQYPGICLPGEQEALEDMRIDIDAQKERLHLIEKQENVVGDLIVQNEHTNEQLNLEITKLNAAQQQTSEEEKTTAEECIKLAENVETLVEDITQLVGKTMDFYGNCGDNKETAQTLFTFGPFEQYKQSQDLFQSHFDLYTSKKFLKRQTDTVTDDNMVLNEAKHIEERLSDAITAYIESKAELCGEQAKLELVANYNNPHPSQISMNIIEAQTTVQLLEQEEGVLEQHAHHAAKELAEERTTLAGDTAASAALAVREEIHEDLAYLLDNAQHALALDKILYCALRHELRNVEEFLQFASQLRMYVNGENEAIASRIDSMLEISSEQSAREQRLQTSDRLVECLYNILNAPCTDGVHLVKLYRELQENIRELRTAVGDACDKRKEELMRFKETTRPLIEYIWDGCTKQPNCTDKTVASLAHALSHEMARVDERILEASASFSSVKNGDKQHLRKLWQWFLTDPSKLLAAVKAAQSGKFNL